MYRPIQYYVHLRSDSEISLRTRSGFEGGGSDNLEQDLLNKVAALPPAASENINIGLVENKKN